MMKVFFVTIACLFLMWSAEDDLMFTINYKSPYGCSHQITVKENGEGLIIAEREAHYDNEELVFKQIIKKEKFKVDNKDLEVFEELVSNISVPLIKAPVNDGFRYTLVSDENQIQTNILKFSFGEMFFLDDFAKYGPSENIRKVLSRLEADGIIERLAHHSLFFTHYIFRITLFPSAIKCQYSL